MLFRQSQQAWIISAHLGSPLVQVRQTPSLVISHLHIPMTRLQQHAIMPFIMTQQLHMPPAIMVHMFWTMLHAILSSHEQVIFMPPVHFSIFMVQRGTIIQFGLVGIAEGVAMPGVPIPGIPMLDRSIIMLPVIAHSLSDMAVRPVSMRNWFKPAARACLNYRIVQNYLSARAPPTV